MSEIKITTEQYSKNKNTIYLKFTELPNKDFLIESYYRPENTKIHFILPLTIIEEHNPKIKHALAKIRSYFKSYNLLNNKEANLLMQDFLYKLNEMIKNKEHPIKAIHEGLSYFISEETLLAVD